MSIIKGLVTGVKAIFGAGSDGASNVMKVATGIGGWIDEQQFTPEEKAKYSAETIKQFQVFMENTIKENTQRSITRREIAIWVIRNWFAFLWVAVIGTGFELAFKWSHEFSTFVFGIATHSIMSYLVLGVGAFFFGAHIIRQTKLANPQG